MSAEIRSSESNIPQVSEDLDARPHNYNGEAPEHFERIKWGHAAISKFEKIAERYSNKTASGALVVALGVIIGYEVLQRHKHNHGIESNEEALSKLTPQHFDDFEDEIKKEKKNGNNGHKFPPPNRSSRFNIGPEH